VRGDPVHVVKNIIIQEALKCFLYNNVRRCSA
jgi:hypothetical protein